MKIPFAASWVIVICATIAPCLANYERPLAKHCTMWNSLRRFSPAREKPIVIVTPSYCNKDWYERNLGSVCFQNYKNYHVIYVDDASTDGTAGLVEGYLKKHNKKSLVTLIKNEKRCGHLANFYKAIHSCPDEAIIVVVDGDDWLAHKNVLALLNKVYTSKDVWLTYGQYKGYPVGTIGCCREIPDRVRENRDYRHGPWIYSHLRTFYAWLFKKIPIQDLCIAQGKFFMSGCDLATMWPMVEMAESHICFIPDVLTIYNRANVLHIEATRRDELKTNSDIIRELPPYNPLKSKHDQPTKVCKTGRK